MRALASIYALVAIAAVAGCGDNRELAATEPAPPACSDGLDNDGDGKIDHPDDPGCESPDDPTEDNVPLPACSDGLDNDGDGKIDYPEDPGCIVAQADSEADDCPDGPGCPECGDGRDNDGDGKTDYPGDPACAAAAGPSEVVDDPAVCGAGLRVEVLPPAPATIIGSLSTASTSQLTTPCGGGGGAPAIAYAFHLTLPKVLVASTESFFTTVDTVLDVRSAACADPGAHIACHDDISATDRRSKLVRPLQPGTYYLIVESSDPAEVGTYGLSVELLPGQGSDCVTDADCGPGLVCRIPVGSTTRVCSPPVCGDGLDDDGDGLIDYPDDPTCIAASTANESCAQSEALLVATTPQTTGTTVGASDDFRPPPGSYHGHLCSSSTTHTAPDVAIQLDVPAMTSLSLKLSPVGFDSSHSLLDASCTGMPIECYDSPTGMVLSNVAGGRYYLVVDGYSTASGTFTLNVAGTIADGESCEAPLAQSGAITCGVGRACKGTAGARTCQPAECADGADNNGDGRTDYPADPGCISTSDDAEDTVCPGASCPACADGVDNDGDGAIDYPADAGCVAASADNEGCAETDPIVAITTPTTTGTLVGATDDHNPSCVATNLPDVILTLDIPTALQSLTIDTENSVVDTVLSLMNSTCSEPSIACDDDGGVGVGDSLISRSFVPAGSYTIAVDSDSTTLGTFELHVAGVILPGGSCESSLFAAGVLSCPVGFGCNGTPGARRCSASQCQDGLDNNGDGRTDYPADPGCDSASDNAEDTVCPGPACPACSDGVDNDGDGDTDYPADDGCGAASDGSEGCVDADPIVPITAPRTTGTLVGASNDHQPACVTSAGVDRIFTLDVPALQSLSIDTEGSVVDTVLSLMSSACAEPSLSCDNDGGVGAGDSLITRSFLPAGSYTIAVDANTTTPNTFILNVSGVIVPGGNCESPLVAAGVLSCSTGFACTGPAGARTCTVAECLDGIDNNGDGRVDFPDDPGCDSFSDNSEDTLCPGPACPACSDGIDNDGDGLIDFPVDPSCFAAAEPSEACTKSEPLGEITEPVTTGNTAGQINDYKPTCSSSTHSAPDLVYAIQLPPMVALTLNLTGFDTAHSLLDSTCGGTPVACSDPPLMTLGALAAGTYYVVVDGWSSGNGPWTLTTSGIVQPGGSCEVPLFQSGAFSCTSGFVCAGPAGARTCSPSQCHDGVDNNGDGTIDYPFDPGCASPSDDSETTVCPGPECPVCSNTLDDDGDSAADYPLDFGCAAAGGTTEVFCPLERQPATVITMPQTAGTLAAPATDDYEQSCQVNTGNDRAYALQLPVPVDTLVVDTLGSTITNTVVSVWDASCAVELGCDDNGAPGTDNRSLLTLTDVPAGNYAIQVDGFSTSNNGAFLLNVLGTARAGAACTDPLFAAGVLVCPAGTTCTAGTCQ